mmetsp:Transcript_14858/g.17056  ORF Transcript_14858/g.17056 Transcript_14858/m.17056 type:complete len:451 (+) Transcript_14858:92-1444(+)
MKESSTTTASSSVKVEPELSSTDIDLTLDGGGVEGEKLLEDEIEDDELLRTIDVYLSPKLANQIYLMQFPLQHSNVPLPQTARIKKRHGMIELDHPLPGNIGTEGNFYLAARRQISTTIPVSTHLALGKFDEDGKSMSLIPLNHITQMRPSFDHVNDNDQQVTDEDETRREEARRRKNKEKNPLMLTKKESERAAMIRKSSYAYKRTSELEEEWQELTICGSRTPEYKYNQEALISFPTRTKTISVNNDKENFVKKLHYIGGKNDFGEDDDAITAAATSVTGEKDMSHLIKIVKKLTMMISKGVPVTYSVIRPIFPTRHVDDHDLIQCLASCAVLVRGNFYLQSRLLNWGAAHAEARTFMLYVLHTHGTLQRKGIEAVYEGSGVVTSDWIAIILQQIALRCRNGYTPRLADNLQFLQDYMEPTQIHNQYWERKSEKFKDKLTIYYDNTLK